MPAGFALPNISRRSRLYPPSPRLWGGRMMARAAGRAAPAIKLAVLALLVAIVAGLAGIPGAGEVAAQGRVNYASAGDPNLIDIRNLAQLAAVHWDLNGNGMRSELYGRSNQGDWDQDWDKYEAAFPNAMPGMGCASACVGYELMADLDFDTNGNGFTHTDGSGDAEDAYYNDGAGWMPITGHAGSYHYTAIFEGNDHTISNLYINLTSSSYWDGTYVGLFGRLTIGTVRNVGLINPYVKNTRSGDSLVYTGALVGGTGGSSPNFSQTVSGSYVKGGAVETVQNGNAVIILTGCLVGSAYPLVVSDSWASCDATSGGSGDRDDGEFVGGLIGGTTVGSSVVRDSYATGAVRSPEAAGGLAGLWHGKVLRSYATGSVRGGTNAGGLVGQLTGGGARIDASYATGEVHGDGNAGGLVGQANGARIDASYATGKVTAGATGNVGGLVGQAIGATQTHASYWDTVSSGIADDADDAPPEGKTSAGLQRPTGYAGIYKTWNDHDIDGDGDLDKPWDFGDSCQYPALKLGGRSLARQRAKDPVCPPYVAPPIVYNLNIRFNVKGLTLDEGETAFYQVRMSRPPVGHPARVAITSNNPDVVVSPSEVTFSSADYSEWQTVKVTVRRDANDTAESATLAHRGPNLSYGSILVSVNDTWPGAAVETVNGHTVTMRHTLDAPYGVRVTAPDTLDADTDITIAGPPAGTPQGAPGYELGESAEARMLADIRVQGTPADGLDICLPVSEALIVESGVHPLTLLRYADGGWAPVAGAERRDGDDGETLLCAAGVMEFGVFAATYILPELGAVSDLAATAGDAPGTVTLTWTPGANAAMHWVAGVKRSDMSDFAVWAAADAMGSHTVSGLDGGETYVFTVTAGRGEGDGREWSAWAAWVTATAANAADAAGP